MATMVNWTGASKRQYEFSLFPIGTEIIPYSGIYIFAREIAPAMWQALYVGEAQSLADRLNAGLKHHDGYQRAISAGATHVGIYFTGDADRLRIETDLRHGLNPVCNAQGIPYALAGHHGV